MVSFKFIETFLFLSLGITFALIVTLVYHFKKRMENMEQKCDTMFDIVQNLANEVIHLKTIEHNDYSLHEGDEHTNNIKYTVQEDTRQINGQLGETVDEDDSSGVESSDDENNSSDDENDSSDDENDSSDDNSEDNDAGNDIIKLTIPDIRVINMNDEITFDEITDVNDTSDDLGVEIIDETDMGELAELSKITEINVSKLSDETIGLDDDEEDEEGDDDELELTTNNNGDTVLTKSALRKIKIANLRTMAASKGVTVDDTMKKNDIIELIMIN